MTTKKTATQKTAQPVSGPIPIKNVALFMAMTTRLIERDAHLPGIAVCNGPSGFGKSYSSIFTQNKTGAKRVEVGDSWTRRTFLRAVLREFGMEPKGRGTISDMAEEAIGALGEDPRRPLIVDEADKMVDKGFIELARELQEFSGAPIILIGEEKLPNKLLGVERVHNRVLEWLQAQPCDLDDTQQLAAAFAPKLSIGDDLLDLIRVQSAGRARRIVVNISKIAEFARNKGLAIVDRQSFGATPLYTGEPPQVRHVEPFKRKAAA
jgi:hypothetical protein